MRRGVWVGAAVLVAVAAAIPLWLALDDGGERRAAALQEPTAAGDVATLTLNGEISGAVTVPVQSFSLELQSPRDAATGQATGQVLQRPLRILRPVDASSPTLFKMLVGNERITSATLDLQGPDSTGKLVTYMSYSLTGANVREWRDGKREEIHLTYSGMTSKPGIVPKGSAGIGLMSAPTLSAEKVPIVDFLATATAPFDPATGQSTGKRQHKPVMVVRSLHSTWPLVVSKLKNNLTLGDITIELQRQGVTYATYAYTGAVAAAVEDSGAAGISPTQRVEFYFQTVKVTAGGKTADDSWSSPTT